MIGVCSWSLRAESPEELVERVRACGLSAVQLALDPLRRGEWGIGQTARALEGAGIAVASGMMAMRGEDYSTLERIRETGGVRLDAYWEENLAAAEANARIARDLGIGLATFHAGFLPEEQGDALRGVMIERVRAVAGAFGACGVRVALETGQESAETLLGVLNAIGDGRVGVNFDPANLILYGMGEPVGALEKLSAHVVQVHVKDAVGSERAGEWGTEVRVGEGEVDWTRFFGVLAEKCAGVDVMIEREAGEQRVEDVRAAVAVVEDMKHRGRTGTEREHSG